MLVDAIIARLEAEIPDLAGRARGALELSELIRQGALPAYSPAAFVVPAGLAPTGEAESSAGAYLQTLDELVAVVLILRSAGDVTGARGQPKLNELLLAVLAALAGWAPEDGVEETGLGGIGVLELRGGNLVQLDAGNIFYQLDFAQRAQLRIFG